MIKTSLKTLLGTCLLGAALSAQAAPTITVGAVTGSAGNTVNVPVTLNNLENDVVGLQLDIGYANASLTPTATVGGGGITGTPSGHPIAFSKIQSTNNKIRVVVADYSNPVAAGDNGLIPSNVVINIPFAIAGGLTNGTVLPLAVTGLIYSDVAAQAVAGTSINGSVTITDILLCDADNSGAIDINDANTIVEMTVGITPSSPAGDCEGDGDVDINDAIKVIYVTVGLGTPGTMIP